MTHPTLTSSLSSRGLVLPHAQPSFTIACPIAATFANWLSTNVSALAITLKPWLGKVNFNLTPEQIFDLFSTARTAPGTTLYVDVSNGNNANPGTSGSPVKSIWYAHQLANAAGLPTKIIIIRAGTSSHYAREDGWLSTAQNVLPTVDVWYEARGGMVDTSTADVAGPTGGWTEDATFKGMYTCTVNNVSQVVDLTQRLVSTRAQKAMRRLASAEACRYQPGYYFTGTTLTVRREDGAAPTTTNTRILRPVLLFRFTVDINIGFGGQTGRDGFRFMGGANGDATSANAYGGISFAQGVAAAPSTRKCLVMSHCLFSHNYRGLEIEGFHGLIVAKDCGAASTLSDGFNFHISTRAGVDLLGLLVNCWTRDNGVAPSGSNQGVTLHDGNKVKVVTFGCDMEGAAGGNVRNIGGSIWGSYYDRFGFDRGDIFFATTPSVEPVGIQLDDAGTTAYLYEPKFDGCEVDIFASAGTFVYIDTNKEVRSGGTGTITFGPFG